MDYALYFSVYRSSMYFFVGVAQDGVLKKGGRGVIRKVPIIQYLFRDCESIL
jgi:hypothetical protein